MRKVFILGSCRTPIGRMGGILSSLEAVELGSIVIKEALKRSTIPAQQIDHVCMGCVIQAGLGQNPARQAAVKAGLPYTTTAQTVNSVCASSLDAVNSSARLIQHGDADVVIAGGMESMSGAPFVLKNARFGYRMGSPMIDTPLIDTMINDALWDAINDCHMGATAENIAEKWNITREEADAYSVASQNKTLDSIAQGKFKDEIVPVTVKGKKENIVADTDEGPRSGLTMEGLARLKPVFKEGGIVTAGNSSGINDGAAALVLVSEDKIKELNLVPEAEWIDGAMYGVDPLIMGIGPVESTRRLLKKVNMTLEDIDLIEVNEAFAAQTIAVKRELSIPDDKLNVNGGAIALGHPVGATGCRILVTLIHAMKQQNARTGIASLCVGGGMGCSTIVKNWSE